MTKLSVITTWLFVVLAQITAAFGQSAQNEFLEAKRLFNEEQFQNAKSAFSSLFDDTEFGPYAVFYAGLSAYRLQEVSVAHSIWKQIPVKYPSWDELGEVYYWLLLSSFELGNYVDAINYSSEFNKRYDSNLPEQLKEKFLPAASKDELSILQRQFPYDRTIAVTLAKKLNKQNPEELLSLESLVAEYEMSLGEYADLTVKTEKKEGYAVGVLLPFMFNNLSQPGSVMANRVIMSFYQGMILAEKDLNLEGAPVTVYPFDTKRRKDVTREILSRERLKEADLIIGPLLGGPIEVANEFSKSQAINLFNPVSSNSSAIADNPYAFLLKPSFETMAKSLANAAINSVENRNALVYFSNNARDSLIAHIYKNEIEKDSFNIIEFRSVDNEQSKEILDSLVAQHEEFIATIEEVDSLMTIPGRFIKEREVDQENQLEVSFALQREEEDGTLGDSLVYYEMKYNVVQDSIGHIMVATRDNGIVNNFIGAIENRPDTIGFFGYGNWLDFKIVDYNQIERLDVKLALAEYFDSRRPEYQALSDRIKEEFRCPPSSFHFLGYETLWFLGSMLKKHGKYFQNAFPSEGLIEGYNSLGFEFGIKNGNQLVPVVTFRNSNLIPINESK